VTLRGGRYVIPIRADARSRVKGIVHDASGSGQTLFVEPLVAVELGNAWREAQLAEAAEIERILDELSALVAGQAGPAARDPRRAGPLRFLVRQGSSRRGDGRDSRRRSPIGLRS
jgi:DNA mismatch repair protein MutS2